MLQVLHFHGTVINYAERLDEEIIQHLKHSHSQETAEDAQRSSSSTRPAPRRGTCVTWGLAPPGALIQAPCCLTAAAPRQQHPAAYTTLGTPIRGSDQKKTPRHHFCPEARLSPCWPRGAEPSPAPSAPIYVRSVLYFQ